MEIFFFAFIRFLPSTMRIKINKLNVNSRIFIFEIESFIEFKCLNLIK